jgi:diguanylate cyclase (GGDEF)-like protein
MSLRDQYRSKALTKANVLLATQATRDPLTSLANRRFASDSIAKIWNDAAVDKTQVAFIMADIDHFKLLNDTAGHAAGDECIQRVAQAIVAASRSGDVVCRYGGEEFLVVLKAVTPAQAWLIAERIRSGVEALGIVNPGLPGAAGITISLGVAFAEPGASPEVVAKWADDALYDAKRTGRNRAFMTRLGPFNEAEKAAAARPAVSSPA